MYATLSKSWEPLFFLLFKFLVSGCFVQLLVGRLVCTGFGHGSCVVQLATTTCLVVFLYPSPYLQAVLRVNCTLQLLVMK